MLFTPHLIFLLGLKSTLFKVTLPSIIFGPSLDFFLVPIKCSFIHKFVHQKRSFGRFYYKGYPCKNVSNLLKLVKSNFPTLYTRISLILLSLCVRKKCLPSLSCLHTLCHKDSCTLFVC